MMLAFAVLVMTIVVSTAASAVLLSLPHGTLFFRVMSLQVEDEEKRAW